MSEGSATALHQPKVAPWHSPAWAGRFADGFLGTCAQSHARACAALLLLGLVCFLPGISTLQPMDRDEPRFAQASKQMLESGDFVSIRFHGEARNKKPVGIHWAQAATVAVAEAVGLPEARAKILYYRIPSLIGALAAVLLSYWAALAFLDRRGALLAAMLFGACIMLSAEARLAKTDALLSACSVAAFGALARIYLCRASGERRHRTALIFWFAIAIGILVKGPMVPMFVGLAALILSIRERSARWLLAARPGLGLILTLVVVAPWFVAIALKTGGTFFTEAVGKDMLAKVGSGTEKHWAPPGTYLVATFATYWPGAAFAALSLPYAWVHRRDDAIAILAAWVLPSWLVFEIVATKLPHYVLPLLPGLAILTVLALKNGDLRPDRWGARAVAGLVVLIPVGLTIGLCTVAWTFDRMVPWMALPLLAMACLLALFSWSAFSRHKPETALVLAVAASVFLSPAVLGLTQLSIPSLKVSPRLAAIRDALPCKAEQVASLGYREPSFVFLIGTDLIHLNTATEAAEFLKRGGCRLLFVENRSADAFKAATVANEVEPKTFDQIDGFNINTGRPTQVVAYASGISDKGPSPARAP